MIPLRRIINNLPVNNYVLLGCDFYYKKEHTMHLESNV